MTEIWAVATFCDDIRVEVGNKMSFMGVYDRDLIIPSVPTVLKSLAVFTSILLPEERTGYDGLSIDAELFDNNTNIPFGSFIPRFPDIDFYPVFEGRRHVRFIVNWAGLLVTNPGCIRISVRDAEQVTFAGLLNVKLQTEPHSIPSETEAQV